MESVSKVQNVICDGMCDIMRDGIWDIMRK